MTGVVIRQVNPAGPAVTLDLIGRAELAGGVGGWSEINRPRRSTAVEWTGTPLRSMVLPLLVDGTEVQPGVDVSIEPTIAQLYSWGRDEADEEPPRLALAGPLPATDGRWVLQDIALGEQEIRNAAGSRVQQALTLTLWEYLAPQIVVSPAKRAKAKKKNKDKADKDKGGSKGDRFK